MLSHRGMFKKCVIGEPQRYQICTFSFAFLKPSAEQNIFIYTDL